MPSRRTLLGLGAAAALSAATSSCRSAQDPPRTAPSASGSRSAIADPSPSPSHSPRRAAYPGEPAPGHLYFGASLPHHRPLRPWERSLGTTLSVHRSYFRPDANETVQMLRRCRADHAHHRLPHVSTKTPGSWRDVATGYHDDWLTQTVRALGRVEAPVFLTVHHEPENDAGGVGMEAPDFVAMQRRVIDAASRAAPLVTVVPVIQHWSFEPLRGRIDPMAWVVDEAAVLGVDVYNPWSPTNGKRWLSFGARIDEVFAWIGERPLAIGEFGCRDDPDNPGVASDWLRSAVDYARRRPIVSMSYFNSGVNAPDGTLELQGDTERTFAELLAAPWVARVT